MASDSLRGKGWALNTLINRRVLGWGWGGGGAFGEDMEREDIKGKDMEREDKKRENMKRKDRNRKDMKSEDIGRGGTRRKI